MADADVLPYDYDLYGKEIVSYLESAQARWRAVNAPHLVALVRAGAVFHNGVLVERRDAAEAAA